MAVKIGHAASDENGNIVGGKAGDQTGKEVCIRDWWAMGWTHLIRPKDPLLAERLATLMEQACANNMIGYGQDDRLTLYYMLLNVAYKIQQIKTPCECDCSSLMGALAICAGVNINPDIYTGNMVQAFRQTGLFEIITDKEHLTNSQYIMRGDILVKEYSHTVMALSNGSKITDKDPVPEPSANVMYAESFDKKLAGSYKVTTALNLRCGAGKTYKIVTVLPKDAVVQNYGYYTLHEGVKWLYVKYKTVTGFCSSAYLKKE